MRRYNPYLDITQNMPLHCAEIFKCYKNDDFAMKTIDSFLIFAQNMDCGYTLEPPHDEAVLTSTQNLCFRANI